MAVSPTHVVKALILKVRLLLLLPTLRSEEHTSELQSRPHLVCRLLLEKKKIKIITSQYSHARSKHFQKEKDIRFQNYSIQLQTYHTTYNGHELDTTKMISNINSSTQR